MFWRRATTYAGIALLLGLMGGVSMAAVAGSRRTVTAFPRFRHSTNPSDVQVNLGPFDPTVIDAINHLPEVARTATYVAFYTAPLTPDGEPDLSYTDTESVGSLDGLYFTQDRFTPTDGRLPDPSRDDEVAVNLNAARSHHLRVGQRLEIGVFDRAAIEEYSDTPPAPADRLTVTVVGVGVFNDEVVQDEADRNLRFLYTPAFTKRESARPLYFWTGVKLHKGNADVAAFKRDFVALLDEGAPEFFRVDSVITAQAQRAVRPLGVALGVFGALAGLATVLLVGQALARLLRSERDDLGALRAIGAGPVVTSAMGLPGAAISVLLGIVAAGGMAWALSSLTPIGPLHSFEVYPGPRLDWAVIGLGAVVLAAGLGLIAAVASVRQSPHRQLARAVRGPRRSSTAGAAATAGLPVPAVVGIRLALEPGEGRTAVPVRATMTGAVVAVVALVASVVFGASLDSLVHHPRLYGWGWEVTLIDQAGYGNTNRAKAHELLDSDPDVAARSGVYFGSLDIDGHNVPTMGVELDAAVFPTVRSGRSVRALDEIVLGVTTLADLHKRVGDTVLIGRGSQSQRMRVVGSAVLPTIGISHGAYTSVGVGAAAPVEKLPGVTRRAESGAANDGPNAIFIRLRPGADRVAATRRIAEKANEIGESPGAAVLLSVQRPAEIVNYSHMGATPAVLAGALALAVLVSLAVSLFAGVRRRRRDLALLKSLGFTGGQLSATVAWQAATTMLVGLGLGIPLGVVVGRWLWSGFAGELGVLALPSVPTALLFALAGALLVLATLAAVVPARAAGRTPVAAILRSE
jgi:hypothetical protein